MAAVSVSRRATAGIALIVAGALFVLAAILPLVGVNLPWYLSVAELAVAVAFALVALGAVNNTVVKVALLAGAVGWALLALSRVGLPSTLVLIGAALAAVGGLVGAIVLLTGREIDRPSSLAFLIAAAIGVIHPFCVARIIALGPVSTLVLSSFGIALIVAGVLFRRKQRR